MSRTVQDVNRNEISHITVEKSWRRVPHIRYCMLLEQLTLAEVNNAFRRFPLAKLRSEYFIKLVP